MLKSGVVCTGIYHIYCPELIDTAQSLEERMLYNIVNYGIGNRDQTVDRIVDILYFIGRIFTHTQTQRKTLAIF